MTSTEWLQVGWSVLAALGGPSVLWAAGRWLYTQHGLQARVVKLEAAVDELEEHLREAQAAEQKARDDSVRAVVDEINEALVQQARIAGRIDAADIHRRWLQEQSQRHSAKLRAVRTPPAPKPDLDEETTLIERHRRRTGYAYHPHKPKDH